MSSTPSSTAGSVKERKVSQSASSKIDSIIRQLFLPMISMPTPERTSFLPEEAEDSILHRVTRENPSAMASETSFVDYMVLLYRKFQRENGAHCQGNDTELNDTPEAGQVVLRVIPDQRD